MQRSCGGVNEPEHAPLSKGGTPLGVGAEAASRRLSAALELTCRSGT